MTSTRRTISAALLGTVAIAALVSTGVRADDHPWYLGVNLGQARATIDEVRIVSDLQNNGFVVDSFGDDDRETGSKLFLGYLVNDNLAFEGGYFRLGSFDYLATTTPTGTLTGNAKFQGVNFDVVGFLPINDALSAFGRLGVQYAEADDRFAGTGAVNVLRPFAKERNFNPKVGLGLHLDFSPNIAWRLEYERYRIDDAVGNAGDIDLLSLGLVIDFARYGQPAMAEARPAPAPAPAPAPVVVLAPAPTEMERYCAILDIQFEINADEMQRQDTERLQVVGTFMQKYPRTTAVIEGHTDNVGTAADNMTLSQRRADAVTAYLRNTFQIAPSRLRAKGFGDTRPIASNATQDGQRLNRRIGAVIACANDIEGLQPLPARVTMALLVEFDANDSKIKPEYRGELERVAKYLKANPTVTATVEGHTGNIQGTPELAMAISQRRAQAVVDYLVAEFGVARSRLGSEGFGQTRRFAYNTDAEGRGENRRVNIIINYPR